MVFCRRNSEFIGSGVVERSGLIPFFTKKTIYQMVVFGARKNIVFIKNRVFGDLLSIIILYLAN
jgi:hypothetical protein